MKTKQLLPGIIFCFITVLAQGRDNPVNEKTANANLDTIALAENTATPPSAESTSKTAPLKPYPRLLPLQISAPTNAQVDIPLDDITINLDNPGGAAPNARLRIMIHDKDHRLDTEHHDLNTNNIKVEVQEGENWKPVVLGMIEDGVMGAIGSEGVTEHRERHKRGGFAIPPGAKKSWRLRMTFSLPGTYSLVAAVSPDNGSRHIAQPVNTVIVVQ